MQITIKIDHEFLTQMLECAVKQGAAIWCRGAVMSLDTQMKQQIAAQAPPTPPADIPKVKPCNAPDTQA